MWGGAVAEVLSSAGTTAAPNRSKYAGKHLFLAQAIRNFMRILGAVGCLLIVSVSTAGEPARAFLDGLRVRGYHDVALDYLDQMAESPLAPVDLKQTVLYEKAVTMIAASRLQRDIETQERLLANAQQLLERFVGSQGSHPKANAARSQLGSLIFERARMRVAQSKQGDTDQRLAEARKLYQQAFDELRKLQLQIESELDEIPLVLDSRDRKQSSLIERRKQLRADNLETELLAAAIREEMADAFAEGSTQRDDCLQEAASLYDDIYKNYRSRLAGYYARMFQGRCNQRLGKLKDALGYYGELLDQPNESAGIVKLKTETLSLAMECWLAPSQRKYMETIKRGSEWLLSAPPNQKREAVWLAIQFHLARAYAMQADAAKKLDPPNRQVMRRSASEALALAKFVAAEPGDLQESARELVTSLGGINEDLEDSEPKTFTEARRIGKESLDAIQPAAATLQALQTKLAGDHSPQAQTQLSEANAVYLATRDDALHYFRLALELADESTSQSDLNLTRYFLCYLYFVRQDHFEAALVGEFVSQRYPDSAAALQCANIALASYLRLFESDAESERTFEIDRLVSVANHMADRWPQRPESDSALRTIIPHLINAGELRKADQLVSRLGEASPGRMDAEFATGQAMWAESIQLAEQIREFELQGTPDGIDLSVITTDRHELEQRAFSLLSAAFHRLPDPAEVTRPRVTALLSLAMAANANSEEEMAVEVLEHDQLGPLTLADQKHEVLSDPRLTEEIYKTALQAYVGSLGADSQGRLAAAKRVMTALQQSIQDDENARKRMLGVYVSLAQRIESQMKSATPDAKLEMGGVFEAFLQQLGSESSDPAVLNWVAETFAGIGGGFDVEGDVAPERAQYYYQQSIAAFQNLLSKNVVTPATATQFRVRMARVMVRSRRYNEALAELEQVLATNPKALNVQVTAARLLQSWGKTDPAKYSAAITGMQPPSNVWGWGKIAKGTLNHRQFRETFFEARYELARCQFDLAQQSPTVEKSKLLASAHRNIAQMKQLYPTLGGSESAARYHGLMNQILNAQGKPPEPASAGSVVPAASPTP